MAVQDVVLAAPVRTPIGKFGGVFSELSAADLGTFVVKACLERAELPADVVSELILGNARQAGTGPNIARQVLYRPFYSRSRSEKISCCKNDNHYCVTVNIRQAWCMYVVFYPWVSGLQYIKENKGIENIFCDKPQIYPCKD